MKEDKSLRTLEKQAFERAKNPKKLNAGTPHDWEDLEQFKENGTTTNTTKTSK
tara:strand:+ start:2466 stop:2624 length:159 start_codon:yes stop_codon:yes gene_type:complete